MKKTIFILFLCITLCSSFFFLAGAYNYKNSYWPFGRGYYGAVKKPITEVLNTTTHALAIKNYGKSYDSLAILDESNEKEIQIIGLKGNATTDEFAVPLDIYKAEFDLIQEKSKEVKIFTIKNNYRVGDVLVTDDKRIFVSYVVADHRNYTAVRLDELIKDNKIYSNKKIYQTPFMKRTGPMSSIMGGGKMIEYQKDQILLAVGTLSLYHYNNNVNKLDPSASTHHDYGKIIKIDLITNKTEIFSSGHRNPHGLSYSKDDEIIIETEHGPMGGDEINIIEYGQDYGWPFVSYGIDYDTNDFTNQFKKGFGRHDGYKKPMYAFLPDVGIKGIQRMSGNQTEFPHWNKNYFLCSTHGFFRIAVTENKPHSVIFRELIPLDVNCRDMEILKSGKIITNTGRVIRNNDLK
ncbi:MAG: PQQ-dependent sugar dehydrogenase [Emcibacteraceae bacterium]